MKKSYEIKKKYYQNSNDYFLVIYIIPEMINVDYFLNSDFIKLGVENQKWYLDSFKEVLDDKEEIIVREGDIVELTISKEITKVKYILHDNLGIPLEEIKEDLNDSLEDVINTKKLYDIMITWSEVVNKNRNVKL